MSFEHRSRDGVVLSGLSKSYGPVEAVRGIDLSISPGETVALLGPNGAGKSTTIDMMLGLTRPDAGTVTLFDLSPPKRWRRDASAACSRPARSSSTSRSASCSTWSPPSTRTPSTSTRCCSTTGTADFADQRTTKLSGGQTQRVRFALALVANPDLLVLDEPTAALDVEGRRDFWDAMRAVAEARKTIVFATHYLEEADAYADRIVLMARGRIVADGPRPRSRRRPAGGRSTPPCPTSTLDALGALPGVTSADRRATRWC